MLRVEGLSKKLGDFSISGVSFDVAEGEYFVLLGASGVGKTILLETITGIIPADEGRIVLEGRDITRERIQRRRIGLVFQNQALFPHMSVRGNIEYGLRSGRVGRGATAGRVEAIARDLEITGLLGRRPETLSGGEAQRVALARALVTEPACLLLDEPLASLDIAARSGMRALLRRLNRNGMTMLHVTHDYEEAISLATRIGVMERGTIAQTGSPRKVFSRPDSEFVARFVGIKNFFPGRLVRSGGSGDAVFESGGLNLVLMSDAQQGDGHVVIRSEDVTVSTESSPSSARNVFEGTVLDIFPVRLGVEVIVDAGVEIAALVTAESVERLGLDCGSRVYVHIKASAVRFIEE
jgi:molybdate/tungstate transport system ATP-binding protein